MSTKAEKKLEKAIQLVQEAIEEMKEVEYAEIKVPKRPRSRKNTVKKQYPLYPPGMKC